MPEIDPNAPAYVWRVPEIDPTAPAYLTLIVLLALGLVWLIDHHGPTPRT